MFTFLEITWFPKNQEGQVTRASLIHPTGEITRYPVEEIKKIIQKMVTAEDSETPEAMIASHPNCIALHLLNYLTSEEGGYIYHSQYPGIMNENRRQIVFCLEKRNCAK